MHVVPAKGGACIRSLAIIHVEAFGQNTRRNLRPSVAIAENFVTCTYLLTVLTYGNVPLSGPLDVRF